MKPVFFSFLFLLISVGMAGQYTLIPDSAFEAKLISLGIDSEGTHDGQVLTSDAQSTTELVISSSGITDLTGIEAFTAVEKFWPGFNDITEIDVSNMPNLEDFRAGSTLIDAIDLSNNPLLINVYLFSSGPGFTSIDLSNNPLIRYLLVASNQLTDLDVSGLTDLIVLKANNNPLTSIDLSQNLALNELDVSYTDITSVDLSNNTNLYTLTARGLNLSSVDLSNNNIGRLSLGYNLLEAIDLSHMTNLQECFLQDNRLTALDLSQNLEIDRVNVSLNLLTDVNVQNGTNGIIDFFITVDNPDLTCVQVDDPVYSEATWLNDADPWTIYSTGCSSAVNCSVFDTAPVDLTKSFDPVNNVQDRVQLKWFKAVPEVKYTDEDAAACDIKFWAKRDLDPISGTPVGPAITDPDTLLITDAKKFLPDGVTPREIFKWPVKYRADGANNTKRVEPNIRYEWKVRCACEHGAGQESPWSVVKIFNTPDFDPVTGVYTPLVGFDADIATKTLAPNFGIHLYPNPSKDGHVTLIIDGGLEERSMIEVFDLSGRKVKGMMADEIEKNRVELDLSDLGKGSYVLRLTERDQLAQELLIIE